IFCNNASTKPERSWCCQNAELVDARVFVQPSDIVAGNSNLNLAFVANLFHKFPSCRNPARTAPRMAPVELAPVELAPDRSAPTKITLDLGADAEEKTYRNWMNSMGVAPRVNYLLYTDLRSGLTLFHLYDLIRPALCAGRGLENAIYAVETRPSSGFQPRGIGGEDLLEGNVTLTLALVWQLMRAWLAARCSWQRIDERAIIAWANQRLERRGGKSAIWPLLNARLVLDLIDCLRPGSVNYANVNGCKMPKLAINLGWRAGAKIYALPEDIVEVKPKMVMTIFACLMQLDFESPATVKLAASPVSTTSNSSAGGDSLGSGSASQQ
uniref:Calponin-homology (CH) domain-containing protein n=1 Tax=Macrostomum lignano TaxID=282301 RepID=A0A1I8FLP9_9PLAT